MPILSYVLLSAGLALTGLALGLVVTQYGRSSLPGLMVLAPAVVLALAGGAYSDHHLDAEFEKNVVKPIEAKYDIKVTKYSREGNSPDALRSWTIDGVKRECYTPDIEPTQDFSEVTDPVLRCEPVKTATELPEIDTADN